METSNIPATYILSSTTSRTLTHPPNIYIYTYTYLKYVIQNMYEILYLIIAIIVSGDDGGSNTAVEVLGEAGSYLCSLPDLPQSHTYHTQDGLVACGGTFPTSTRTSCISFSPTTGVWSQTHSLMESRYQHSSWSSPLGLILLGGSPSPRTSELVTEDGTSVELFSLLYDTV